MAELCADLKRSLKRSLVQTIARLSRFAVGFAKLLKGRERNIKSRLFRVASVWRPDYKPKAMQTMAVHLVRGQIDLHSPTASTLSYTQQFLWSIGLAW